MFIVQRRWIVENKEIGAVVGIDLGEYKIYCSSGEVYEFPYLNLKNSSNIFEIKKQWKESVAVQLLIKYDLIIFESLVENSDTTSMFKNMLDFPDIVKKKSEIFEKNVHILQRKYKTSQRCNVCGYNNSKLKLNIAIKRWKCPKCGIEHDRDINAAVNILKYGIIECSLPDKFPDKFVKIEN